MMEPILRGDNLYRKWREECESELPGSVGPEWEFLNPTYQIAWGRLGRRLAREIQYNEDHRNLDLI